MRIRVSFDVDRDARRGIALMSIEDGMADYEAVRAHIVGTIEGDLAERRAEARLDPHWVPTSVLRRRGEVEPE